MRLQVDLLETAVECFRERRDCGLIEGAQRADLDGAQLAPLPTQLVEHVRGIVQKPSPEALVGRQLTNDRFHASM